MAQAPDGGWDYFVRSPRFKVQWAGFESDSWRMQSAGWEFAVEYDAYRMRTRVLVRHRETGWTGMGELDDDQLRGAALQHSRYASFGSRPSEMPLLQLRRMTCDHQVQLLGEVNYARVDMISRPEMLSATEIGRALNETGIFRPWAPQAQELIVDPATVSDLLERIRSMQTPELQAIRERNRARDLREQRQENVVAQIITLAA